MMLCGKLYLWFHLKLDLYLTQGVKSSPTRETYGTGFQHWISPPDITTAKPDVCDLVLSCLKLLPPLFWQKWSHCQVTSILPTLITELGDCCRSNHSGQKVCSLLVKKRLYWGFLPFASCCLHYQHNLYRHQKPVDKKVQAAQGDQSLFLHSAGGISRPST